MIWITLHMISFKIWHRRYENAYYILMNKEEGKTMKIKM